MTAVGELEIRTQRRVVAHFRDRLGYEYLGSRQDRPNNRNVETAALKRFLLRRGHDPKVIAKAVAKLEKAAGLGGGAKLYDANRSVYGLLRYGAKVQPGVGEHAVTVHLIDWNDPGANDFAIAEEVTIKGQNDKRPDIVLYVNGIAVSVLELKRSTVSVAEGIRQNLDSQKREFIPHFFATVQLVMAGNDTEGLRYGVVGTPEKHWLRWKEPGPPAPDAPDSPLLRELGHICAPERMLELIHDFTVFDAGVKKICRHNQYFGVKAAQARARRREGGIVWHTQGSGKSLTMVWLAKWLRELPGVNARVLIVTDRTELDEQIEKVFKGVDENIRRTRSGADLAKALQSTSESLICSLVHKFGGSGGESGGADGPGDGFDDFAADLKTHMAAGPRPGGEFFVFVDECHRTQSGKLHRAMKEVLPDATLIGFTGTPLLKSDKARSIEVFGGYIHTYKYDEAISDKVVLDLRYEARDIDQHITSEAKVDKWFDAKTSGLSDLARAQLRQRWGTMRKLASSADRIRTIAADILMDMETRDRLKSGRGNAMLVSDSVHAACRFYEEFRDTDIGDKCAIVTSYAPSASAIKGEETGEGATDALFKHDVYKRMLADHFGEPPDRAVHKAAQFEQEVKRRFVDEPGRMKLLIVVDKLLTGFDAPPATYLYIDKKMRDHGLFQAICRVNRLHGPDKEYGHVIDYKDLFRSLEGAIKDYTGDAFDGYDPDDVKGLLTDRLAKARERLDETRETVKALCEPVEPPFDAEAHLRHFCHDGKGDGAEAARQLKANERRRLQLYASVAAFVRAYANLANEMAEAGYSEDERRAIRDEAAHCEKVRQEVKLASGDYVDLKVFEPAMRHLLDAYIRADDSKVLSRFDDMDLTLVDLLASQGPDAVDSLPAGIRKSKGAVAETIANNVRRLIVDKMAVNPRYYEKMSKVLDELIEKRRREAIDYETYLNEVAALARKVKDGEGAGSHPAAINTSGLRAIYDNLPEDVLEKSVAEPGAAKPPPDGDPREAAALAVDHAVRKARQHDWRGHPIKERRVRKAIRAALERHGFNGYATSAIFDIVDARRDEY